MSTKELMLLDCGVGEVCWESLGLEGDPTRPFWRTSALGVLWKEWCWSWNSNPLVTWSQEMTHLERPWCWGWLKAWGEGDEKGWDGWMASPNQWTWVRASFETSWWTGRPGIQQSMGSQWVGYDNEWTKLKTISDVYDICVSLSDLFHSAWWIFRSIHAAINRVICFCFSLSNVPLNIRTTSFLSHSPGP